MREVSVKRTVQPTFQGYRLVIGKDGPDRNNTTVTANLSSEEAVALFYELKLALGRE